jgi:electron transfer flavoprotein beta subunit
MGADKAVLLKDESERDSFAVAEALSEFIKKVTPDVVLFGKQSIDFDDSAVGTITAEMLGLPSVSVIVKAEIANGKALVEREIEGGREKVETNLPAVFTCQKGLNEPRYPSLKGIMQAKSKPIEEFVPSKVEAKSVMIGMKRPASKNAGKIVGVNADAALELVRLLHEEAKVI